MTTIDAAVKDYKKALKDSDYTLKELEDRASEFAEMQDNRHDSESDFEDAQSDLARVAADKETVKEALSVAVLTGEGNVEELREQYAELTDREQALRDAMGDAAKAIEENTPDSSEVAALTTRLKRFRSPGADAVIKAMKEVAQGNARDVQERVTAAVAQLPTVDPRTAHRTLMELDDSYRRNEGKSMEKYLADEDDKGNVQQATAMLASRLEARERRAVITARK